MYASSVARLGRESPGGAERQPKIFFVTLRVFAS